MKNPFKTTPKDSKNGTITIFRNEQRDMEAIIYKAHDDIMKNTAIPYGKDLAVMNKPEPDCENEQAYCGILSGAYGKLAMLPKTELQTEIEQLHIKKDKEEADRQLEQLENALNDKNNELRLKKRAFDEKDNSLLKKEKRNRINSYGLGGMILIDMLLSSTALQALGYSLIVSYVIGLGIGIGIYFISEYLPLIILKGRTLWQKRAIAITAFLGLATIFYVLGIFRSVSLDGGGVISKGAWPYYFMCLNLFFVIVATAVSYFGRLSKSERLQLDQWKIAKQEKEDLETDVHLLEDEVTRVISEQKHSELTRTQLLIYTRDIQQLVQQLYEEAYKCFMSTNLVHRSDGQIPKFYSNPIPKLPQFFNDLEL